MNTMVIAEIGNCHDGSERAALALVDAARAAGADVVKAQYYSNPARLARRRNMPPAQGDVYARYRLPRLWLPMLSDAAHTAGLQFACTTYLPDDVEDVAPWVDLLKISSFESQDKELLVAHIRPLAAGKPVLISLGMGASQRTARDWLGRGVDEPRPDIRFLACTSAYPAPMHELNIAALRIPGYFGYSDHAPGCVDWTGAVAVAAGARAVERHIRLSDTPSDNPDYPHAMDPAGFMRYVEHIRNAAVALGDGMVKVQQCETESLRYRVGVDL